MKFWTFKRIVFYDVDKIDGSALVDLPLAMEDLEELKQVITGKRKSTKIKMTYAFQKIKRDCFKWKGVSGSKLIKS